MSTWQTLLAQPGPFIADGAMGTQLFQAGLPAGDSPETWNVSHPERVRAVHRGYLEAGAQIILTNTLGGTRFRLALHRLENRVADFNCAGAEIARAEVEAAGRPAIVAGDVGPTGEILAPLGTLEYADAVAGFAEQARALAAGGVDVIWIETMSALEEVQAAIEGARRAAPQLPIVATMTFDTHGRTMMGVTPEQAAKQLLTWGVDALGGNCGNGMDELLAVIHKMHAAAPEALLVAKSNAGLPEWNHGKTVYRGTPEQMGTYARQVQAAGARIIGACCGSTPAHIRAIAQALTGELVEG